MNNAVNLFNSNLAEIKITYRNKQKFSDMQRVNSSKDAVDVLRSVWSDQIEYREEFAVICLNRANRVLGYSFISSGGLAGTVVDAKVVFQIALKSNASSIILAHNHPSGNKQPSDPDINLTKKMKQAGELLDLPVLDHVILTSETYYSLADEGDI